jgi:hypothetical protein
MAKGARRGPSFLPIDMGTNRIEGLGRSTEPDGAARLDDIPVGFIGTLNADAGAGAARTDPTDATFAFGTHKHPAAPVIPPGAPPGATPEMFLYPSEAPDPLVRASVTCYSGFNFHPVPSQTYDENGSFAGGTIHYWTQIAGVSTWQRNDPGALYGSSTADSGGESDSTISYPLQAGDRFLLSATEFAQYQWIYEVVDPGSPTTPAIIRRPADANTPTTVCYGAVVEIVGGGIRNGFTAYGIGNSTAITTSNPIAIDVTVLDLGAPGSYTPSVSYPLLTAPQLISAGADNDDTLTFSAMSVSGGEVYFPYGGFLTLAGTPGLSSLPAGPYGVSLENVCLDNAYDGSANSVKAYIIDALSSTIVATLTSPPITWTTPRTISFQVNLSSAYAILPTSRLKTVFSFTSGSTAGRTCTFTYSSPSRGTWVQLPIQAASAGVTLTGELTPPFWDTYVAIETTPTVKDERVCDFDRLKTATTPVEFTAYAKADSGQTGTLAIMIGGTKDTADGTTIATTTVIGSGAYAAIKVTGTFANPGSLQAVKLALESSDAAHPFFVQGGYLTLGSTTS